MGTDNHFVKSVHRVLFKLGISVKGKKYRTDEQECGFAGMEYWFQEYLFFD
jgi:hypothetical protein